MGFTGLPETLKTLVCFQSCSRGTKNTLVIEATLLEKRSPSAGKPTVRQLEQLLARNLGGSPQLYSQEERALAWIQV